MTARASEEETPLMGC